MPERRPVNRIWHRPRRSDYPQYLDRKSAGRDNHITVQRHRWSVFDEKATARQAADFDEDQGTRDD